MRPTHDQIAILAEELAAGGSPGGDLDNWLQAESELSSGPAAGDMVRSRTGTGEPLVLLHGVGESAAGWNPVVPTLAEEHDVIVLDLPGFASAPAFPAGVVPDARAFADAVERELDALGIGTFHVAGYSLGGRVALELAARQRTRSVVAIAPDGLGTPPERIYQAMALMTGRVLAKALAPVAGLVAATGPGRSSFFAMERSRPWQLPVADARELLTSFATSAGYESTVLATLFDVPRGLHRITCPVLILQGTTDPLVSLQAPRFLAFVPHARLRWLPGASHVPVSDDPGLVSRLMLRFLTSARQNATAAGTDREGCPNHE